MKNLLIIRSPPGPAMLEGVTWFRQSSVRIRRGGVEIHIDPWGIPEGSTADYILLTHPHFDNFSEDDIAKVRGQNTTLVGPASMRKQLEDVDHLLRPGDMVHLDGIEILAVPAYNDGKKFHPAENEWLGYVFTVDGITYYHSGDTDFLEAMNQTRCDVAFLPCEGHYTMGPEDAVRAATACHARVVVPVHWGGRAETRANAERVKELSEGEVVILEQGMPG